MKRIIDITEDDFNAIIERRNSKDPWTIEEYVYDMANTISESTPLEINAVLDKIKTEIEVYRSDAFYSDDIMMKREVLKIIDKYKAESEKTE